MYNTIYNLNIIDGEKMAPNCVHNFDSPFCPECGLPKGEVDVILKVLDELKTLNGGYDAFNSEYSWDDYDKHMGIVSKNHPKTVFQLEGDGEDGGDLWITYYRNGFCQSSTAKITYDDFDETKLVEVRVNGE